MPTPAKSRAELSDRFFLSVTCAPGPAKTAETSAPASETTSAACSLSSRQRRPPVKRTPRGLERRVVDKQISVN